MNTEGVKDTNEIYSNVQKGYTLSFMFSSNVLFIIGIPHICKNIESRKQYVQFVYLCCTFFEKKGTDGYARLFSSNKSVSKTVDDSQTLKTVNSI